MQFDIPSMIGLAGAIIAGIAYIPQIVHLIKEHCSAGISIRAYALWFAASVLVTINAFWIQSIVFITLGLVQIIATSLIYIFSIKYKDQACPTHAVNPTQS